MFGRFHPTLSIDNALSQLRIICQFQSNIKINLFVFSVYLSNKTDSIKNHKKCYVGRVEAQPTSRYFNAALHIAATVDTLCMRL